jgi:ABC-type dipeptide/oligopeptide/nickel transport system permease component
VTVARLLGRKVLLMLILLPLLHAAGFYYAHSFAGARVMQRFEWVRAPVGESFRDDYAAYLAGVREGNWGDVRRVPIESFLQRPLERSARLFAVAAAVTVVLGPTLGLVSVSRRTGRIRGSAQAILSIGSTVPGFFFGTVLIALLLYLSRAGITPGRGTWIPVQGYGTTWHMVLPVLTLALRPTMYVAYLTAGMVEGELQQDYIRVARSKGIGWQGQLWRHALPNIISPVIVALGQSTRMLVSGLLLVEALFDWRGLGWQFWQVIALGEPGVSRSPVYLHAPLAATLLAIFAAALLLADLIAAVIAHLVDPRLRRAGESRAGQLATA